MGTFVEPHIQKFIEGKIVDSIKQLDQSTTKINFTDGTHLRVTVYVIGATLRHPIQIETVAHAYGVDGKVLTISQIMKNV